MTDDTTLFVGLGSPHGDDQFGWLVAEQLRSRIPIRQARIPAQLLDWLDHIETLHLCDACCGSGAPGQLHHLTWRRGDTSRPGLLAEVARLRSTGTHDYGLGPVLDLAVELGSLPGTIDLWAIEGACFDPGQEISPELEAALPRVVNQIWSRITHA